MANRHFGKMSEVLKHGLLAEVLTVHHPSRFAETHAGSASYPLSHSPERDYGIYGFLERTTDEVLRASAYRRVLDALSGESGDSRPKRCPGSPLVAMSVLGDHTKYLFFDTDPESIASIEATAHELDLSALVHAHADDGSSEVMKEFRAEPSGCVHIDPFDPFSPGKDGGPSPVEVARILGGAGTTVLYWYGYEEPDERFWAWDAIAEAAQPAHWWIGDLAYAEPESDSGIIGCGVLVGNGSDEALARCEVFGRALEQAYGDAKLPSGAQGSLSFESR